MKKMKDYTIIITLILAFGLTSCFEEKDDDYVVVGAVATIPVFTLSKTAPAAGEQITINIRYYSENIKVSELRLTQTIGTGTASVVQTKTITDFDMKNSYTDSFTYTVPAATTVGTKIVLAVEVETANELVNSKSGTVTVN